MSRVREATDAFHDLCVATLTDVSIYYAGKTTQEYPARSLFVAYNGDPEGAFMSATSDQQWAGLGAKKRDEVITFPCCLQIQRGDEELGDIADEIFGLLDQISDAITLDPSIGMTPPFPNTAGIIRQEFYLSDTETGGAVARIIFTVRVDTRF